MANKKTTFTPAKGLFLISGLCLFIKFILDGSLSFSLGNTLPSIVSFIGSIIVLILIVGLFFLFFFGVEGYSSSFKALAPTILLLAIGGKYSLDYGNADINSVLVSIANIIWMVMLVSGFVFLFVHKKVIGMTLAITSLVYALFVSLSYFITLIIKMVNGEQFFEVTSFLVMLLLTISLALIFAGLYISLRRKEWTE